MSILFKYLKIVVAILLLSIISGCAGMSVPERLQLEYEEYNIKYKDNPAAYYQQLSNSNYSIRFQHINDQRVIATFALKGSSYDTQISAVKYLTDKNTLSIIALNKNSLPFDNESRRGSIISRSKWRRQHEEIRVAAIEKLTDQKILEEIMFSSPSSYVSASTLERITDQKILGRVALTKKDSYSFAWDNARLNATKRLTHQSSLEKLAFDKRDDIRKIAANRVIHKKILAKIALKDKNSEIREIAINRIIDQKILEKVAIGDEDEEIRILTVNKLSNQKVIGRIALRDKSESVRIAAVNLVTNLSVINRYAIDDNIMTDQLRHVSKLTNPKVLFKYAKKNHHKIIRQYSSARLLKLYSNKYNRSMFNKRDLRIGSAMLMLLPDLLKIENYGYEHHAKKFINLIVTLNTPESREKLGNIISINLESDSNSSTYENIAESSLGDVYGESFELSIAMSNCKAPLYGAWSTEFPEKTYRIYLRANIEFSNFRECQNS